MLTNSKDVVLHRRNTEKNMQRFYVLSIQPNLFGGSSLIRSWGRIGTKGQYKIEMFNNMNIAQDKCVQLFENKLRRGYKHHR